MNNIKGIFKLFTKLLLSVFVVMLITFYSMEMLSGDIADIIAGTTGNADEIRASLGLDKSSLNRFWFWVTSVLQGNFGNSIIFETSVVEIVNERLIVSLPIALISLFISLTLGLIIGLLSVLNNNQFWQNLIMGIISFPAVWLGLLLIMIFSLKFNLLPSGGAGLWQHYVLPSLTLGISQAGIFARYVRVSLLDITNKDFIHFYQVVGFSKAYVLIKYGLPSVSASILSIIGLQVGFLFTGVVVIEHIFAMPGIGDLLYQAILNRDVLLAGYIVMNSALFIIIINSAVDFITYILTPALRKGYNA
ncbi:MAG: ABC transporter permease [Alphaproteobacteria bacterium]